MPRKQSNKAPQSSTFHKISRRDAEAWRQSAHLKVTPDCAQRIILTRQARCRECGGAMPVGTPALTFYQEPSGSAFRGEVKMYIHESAVDCVHPPDEPEVRAQAYLDTQKRYDFTKDHVGLWAYDYKVVVCPVCHRKGGMRHLLGGKRLFVHTARLVEATGIIEGGVMVRPIDQCVLNADGTGGNVVKEV
jgi:hypothetical protein